MSLEIALFGYAGFANLARSKVRGAGAARSSRDRVRLRAAGGILLFLSFLAATHRFGAGQGIVAWLALLSASGIAFVLVFSRWPETALAPRLPMAAVALILCLV